MFIKRLIFSVLFCFACVYYTPGFAVSSPDELEFADVTENDETEITDTDTEDVDEIDESNSEYYDVLSVVDELDWCPNDGSAPHNARKAEICKMISEIGDLDEQLATNTEALEENYQNMEDKENSLENRMLGAAGIGTVGIGGMMAASALSEQNADKAAEQDMQAYLSTFSCSYPGGTAKGGQTGIELGGANQLIDLYTQYAELAADLKERKNALGLTPGIESEIVIDKAEAGLYDDTGTGIGSGAYASIARALRDPNGKDAQKWKEQKESTSKQLKIGAGVAIAGAAATAIANYAINHNNKDKSKELLEEREKLKSRFAEISSQMVTECNALIQEHKEFAQTLSAELLSIQEWAEYKQAVDEAQPITNIIEIKDSKFCK